MEIKEFARECFGAEFPLFAKSDVNGEHANEVWRYLRRNSSLHNANTNRTAVIPWNFSKFVISARFSQTEFIGPRVEMPRVRSIIESILQQ